MHIVFLAHPSFLGSQSMPRYANYLRAGMAQRGHSTEIWQPEPRAYRWPGPASARKWLGYVDQYVLFPQQVRWRRNQLPVDTLFVLTDHALGPYAPLVANRPHVIHCHDFLAQRSALGQIPENPTSWTGRHYQAFIRRGFAQGRNFISISTTTQHDLHTLLGKRPPLSEIVYNGLLDAFSPAPNVPALRQQLQQELGIDLAGGFVLHVGGNQWYKNRRGVILVYDAWRATTPGTSVPLLMAGSEPDAALRIAWQQATARTDIHFLTAASDALVKRLYQAATVLLFPSLAEGFGWPIIEAMASGCPVITTDAPPMTEVAGGAAVLLPPLPNAAPAAWAQQAANTLDRVVHLPDHERFQLSTKGLQNVSRFDANSQLNRIEAFYQAVVETGR